MHSSAPLSTTPARRSWSSAAPLLLLALLAACAAGDPRFMAEAPAGFWTGLWHGIISWVTLVIGIFTDDVAVYELHNTGGWYDFGFLLGIGAMWGGGSRTYHFTFRGRPCAVPPPAK